MVHLGPMNQDPFLKGRDGPAVIPGRSHGREVGGGVSKQAVQEESIEQSWRPHSNRMEGRTWASISYSSTTTTQSNTDGRCLKTLSLHWTWTDFCCCLRHGLVYTRLPTNSLCSWGCPSTANCSAFTSQGLGLEVCSAPCSVTVLFSETM